MSNFFESESEIDDDERLALCDAVDGTSSVTKLLLILSEYLDHGGNDEVGAELVADFAKVFADHEQTMVASQINKENQTNKLLN
jgi:hypothetical protein